ncbi:MAG TPA: hypothetical protein DDY04_00915 [Bacteroidales bacterium]|nr:hypothetical protein [Bacteroidales bacterium]
MVKVSFDKYSKKRLRRELNTIIQIGYGIISTLDYDKVLQTISNGMADLLKIESSAIYILEDEQEIWLGATTPPLDPNMPDGLRRANLNDHPHIKQAILQQKPVVLEDSKNVELSDAEQMVVNLRKLRSIIYLPFIQTDKAIGLLILGTCKHTRKFNQHEVVLAQTVANQLAVAIQNARLHRDLISYKENLEQLVLERTYELEAANEELKSMNEELSLKNSLILKQKEELETTLQNLKTMQLKLIETEKMASLGVLTAGVAHEINNPLNFIMGAYIGLKNLILHEGNEHFKEASLLLTSMKQGIDRVVSIVRGLNQFSKDSRTNNEDCDVHAIIDNCLLMLQNQCRDSISVVKKYAEGNMVVKGNTGKLHQVFTNIILNSIQAIENQGEIIIKTEFDGKNVIVSVQDNGCGIESSILPRITEPFFTTKEVHKGTGLGLSIAYKIVQEHNGSLAFESEVNVGTKVTVSLPISKIV